MDISIEPLDVTVIGGGPAGISACLELCTLTGLSIALLEGEQELGGMPRSCHIFFGLRDRKRFYTGPSYARKLDRLVRKTGARIYTGFRVLDLVTGSPGDAHELHVLSPEGPLCIRSRFILLATGCFESSRSERFLPGTRPSGIFTTGTLQQLVNLRGLKPGDRALIIGSEHVALSSVLTLKRAGVSIAGLVEGDLRLNTYASVAASMSRFFGFPILKNTAIHRIFGSSRVEGVELLSGRSKETLHLDCDTIVMTGRFRPDSSLIDNTPIEKDPYTLGPAVDTAFMTSVQNIFAAGNVLRGADTHDLCALEGRLAARSIIRNSRTSKQKIFRYIPMRAERPIRYVVPQRIMPMPKRFFSKFLPWPEIQLEKTLLRPTLEAWSRKERIWQGAYRRLLGNTRIPLPIEKFLWDRVDPALGVTLRVIQGV
ncbi:MAG: FAD-dependent oxidoreductase [Deltaproteobacteria bacterium]|nr:FAD-dependent oxidoreductase [Deltaproteobacteria bacterium]